MHCEWIGVKELRILFCRRIFFFKVFIAEKQFRFALTFHVYQKRKLVFYLEEVSLRHQPHLQSVNTQNNRVKEIRRNQDRGTRGYFNS